MNEQLNQQIINRLISDYDMKPSSDGKFLQKGKCPSCGKNELYAGTEAPWTIQCGRLNKCEYQERTRNLYPELFSMRVKSILPTAENPTATADAYLTEIRGLDVSRWRGLYSQENHYNYENKHNSATIRFPIGQEGGYWERLIDPKNGSKAKIKAGFAIKGQVWQAPNFNHSENNKIWICEGIFDALSLLENGIYAVSSISCNNYPSLFLEKLKSEYKNLNLPLPTIVFSYDNDDAGKRYTKDFVIRARQDGFVATAAQAPCDKKQDWNDLHITKKLEPKDIKKYLYFGSLLIAKDPLEKALLIFREFGYNDFYFSFENKIYWSEFDELRFESDKKKSAENKLSENGNILDADSNLSLSKYLYVKEIVNCEIEPLYFQRNTITDESWYYIRIKTNNHVTKNTFTGAQLASASEFKKRLLAVALGVIFRGNSKQLDRILVDKLHNIKKVQTIDFLGYDIEHDVYIFNDIAFKSGKIFNINEDDYFELPNNLHLKTLSKSPSFRIISKPDIQVDWLKDVIDGWGLKGIITLIGFLGSLIAQQIRAKQKSYPFLEIVGEPGTGKSTLIYFLWRLIGREGHEGIDPNKSTKAGRIRAFSQVSNMPTVLIESDRDNSASGNKNLQFQWDELKNLYDGGSIGVRGVKNNGNETYEPPFRGTIIISQNLAVQASEAILSRIVHLFFDTSQQTRESEKAARRIEGYSVEQLSYFLIDFLKQEKRILEIFFNNKIPFEDWLKDNGVKSFRVAHCHAQIYALYLALSETVLPQLQTYKVSIENELWTMAKARDNALCSENPLIIQFWDVYDRLSSRNSTLTTEEPLNHSKDPGYIAISLSQIYQAAREFHYDLPMQQLMQQELRKSISYKFIEANKVVNSRIGGKSIRCWIFKKPINIQN